MVHTIFKKNLILFCGVFFLFSSSFAQDQASSSRLFEAKARAVDAATLVAGKTQIRLWGVQAIDAMPAPFLMSARSTLDNILGSQKIRCELKKRGEGYLSAQCTNSSDLDLGLYMLQQGYSVVDRSVV